MVSDGSGFLLHIAEPTLYLERHQNGKIILLFEATLYYSCVYITGFFHEVTCFTPTCFLRRLESSKGSWSDCLTSSLHLQRETMGERDRGGIEADRWCCGRWSVGCRESHGKGEFSLSQWGYKEAYLFPALVSLSRQSALWRWHPGAPLCSAVRCLKSRLLDPVGGGTVASYVWLAWHLWSTIASRS